MLLFHILLLSPASILLGLVSCVTLIQISSREILVSELSVLDEKLDVDEVGSDGSDVNEKNDPSVSVVVATLSYTFSIDFGKFHVLLFSNVDIISGSNSRRVKVLLWTMNLRSCMMVMKTKSLWIHISVSWMLI